jgi:methylthioribulose-1-phosphate dehydratase
MFEKNCTISLHFLSIIVFQMSTTKESVFESEALCLSNDPQHPANLIPELCRLFYQLGWVTGTGGGISIRNG